MERNDARPVTADIGGPLIDDSPESFDATEGPRVRGGASDKAEAEDEDDRLEEVVPL